MLGTGKASGSITVVPADSGPAKRAFVDVLYRIQAGNPVWVPPLRTHQAHLIDTVRHPFYKHAEARFFLAQRDGRPVGRIAAFDDSLHNRVHNERTTHFGFFDSVDDPAVAAGLFSAVEAFARQRGHNTIRGPFNPSVNEEIGVQVDAFDRPSYVMIPGNPAYYGRLVEMQGYGKSVDLHCYEMTRAQMTERIAKLAPAIERRAGVRLRSIDRKNIWRDAMKIWSVYSQAWERNWYWVPPTEAEFRELVGELKEIADFDLIWLAEDAAGDIVGCSVAIPNVNEALIRIRDGRLLPFGLPRLLWHTRPGAIRSCRVIIMGVLERYRGRGIDALMYWRQYEAGVRKGYERCEMSQILEGNTMMVRALEMVGARRYKTHRMYEKALAGADRPGSP